MGVRVKNMGIILCIVVFDRQGALPARQLPRPPEGSKGKGMGEGRQEKHWTFWSAEDQRW